MKAEHLIKGLAGSADWLSALVLFGLGVAYLVVFLKLLGRTHVQVFGVEIHVKSVWMVFLALTFAHGAVAVLHLKNASKLMFHQDGVARKDPTRIRAWEELTVNGPLVFRHLVKRRSMGLATVPNPMTPIQDPLAIPSYISAIAVCVAHARWKGQNRRSRFLWIMVGVLMALANWVIASAWVTGTAELDGSRDAAEVLEKFRQ